MYHDISNHIVPQVFWKKKTIFLNVFPFFKEKKKNKGKRQKEPHKMENKGNSNQNLEGSIQVEMEYVFSKVCHFPLMIRQSTFHQPHSILFSSNEKELCFVVSQLWIGFHYKIPFWGRKPTKANSATNLSTIN